QCHPIAPGALHRLGAGLSGGSARPGSGRSRAHRCAGVDDLGAWFRDDRSESFRAPVRKVPLTLLSSRSEIFDLKLSHVDVVLLERTCEYMRTVVPTDEVEEVDICRRNCGFE